MLSEVCQYPKSGLPNGRPEKGDHVSDRHLGVIEQVRIIQFISRRRLPELSSNEATLVFWLCGAVVAWGKTSAHFSARQMSEGYGQNAGCGLSAGQLYRALRSLREADAIRTTPTRDGLVIELLPHWWQPVSLVKDQNMVPIPKRLQTAPSPVKSLPGTDEGPDPSPVKGPYRAVRFKTDSQTNTTSPDVSGFGLDGPDMDLQETPRLDLSSLGMAGISHDVQRAQRELLQKMQSTAPRKKKAVSKTDQWFASWRQAVQASFLGVETAPWSNRLRAILKKKAEGFEANALIGKRSTVEEFLVWCAENWLEVRASSFGWMTKNPPPATPDIGFVVAMWDRWFTSYGHAMFSSKVKTLPADKAAYWRLRQAGKSHDEALFQAGKMLGKSQERAALEERYAEAQTAYRMVQLAESRLRPVWSKDNPHPQAESRKAARPLPPRRDNSTDGDELPDLPEIAL